MHFLRYILRLFLAFISRFKGVLFLGILLGLIAFLFVNFLAPIFFNKSSERIGMAGRYLPDSLPEEVLNLAGEGLTKVNQYGEVEPALAEKWETPDKGKTWIFYLKKDKLWQDGKKVTSESITYSFQDVEIERPDEYSLVFKLETPFAPFPSVVAKPAFKKGLLGTGKWKVTNLTLIGSYIEKLILKDSEGNQRIYRFFPTEDRTKLAFKLGEIDRIENLIDPTPFDKWNTVKIEKYIDEGKHVTIFFNTQSETFKDNKPFRQALAYALDKNKFKGERTISPISPKSWAYNPQTKAYDYDLERAKELIEEANIPEENLKVNLSTTPVLLSIAEEVARDWESVGVDTTVLVSSSIPTDFEAFLVIYDSPIDPDQYSTWHSTQVATNISKYTNPRIDKLLEDGRIELDQEERKKIYLDFQRFLVEDSPAIFLYHPLTYVVTRN